MKTIPFFSSGSRRLSGKALGIRHSDFFRHSSFVIRILPLFLLSFSALAFPPAPNHTIYGLVRDQYGVPLSIGNAQIIFEVTNGVQITTTIVPDLEPGVNYRLTLPMDSGTAVDPYKTTALRPFVSFRIRVQVGT